MSAALYGRDSAGVNRQIKKLYASVGGVNRELKELWARDSGGVNRKIFSAYDCRVQIGSNTGGTYVTENGEFYIDVEANGTVGSCYTDLMFYFDTPISRESASTDLFLITADASQHLAGSCFFRALTTDDSKTLDTQVITQDGVQTWHIATGFTDTLAAVKLRVGFTAQAATSYLKISISAGNMYINNKQINSVDV